MITNSKLYGSYVWESPTRLFQDVPMLPDSNDEVSLDYFANACDCAIRDSWTPLSLISKTIYNDNTSIFKFKLPDGCRKLNLPIGAFLLVLAPGCEDQDDDSNKDAVRPYTSISDNNLNHSDETGTFDLLCKRYDQWGMKESPQTHFLFTKTNHSYKPAGRVSNFIHSCNIGDNIMFKFNQLCVAGSVKLLPITRLPYFIGHTSANITIRTMTLISVGVGIAPMIQILRHILFSVNEASTGESNEDRRIKVVLLYGVREVKDILMKELLDSWSNLFPDVFEVVYCVGSRWANVHIAAKRKDEYIPPPMPKGFSTLVSAELGWVNEDKIKRRGFAPADDTRLIVCGLPGVYDKLCGPRTSDHVTPGSALHILGYSDAMVIKL